MAEKSIKITGFVFALVALLSFQAINAQSPHSKALAKFVTSDVVGVLYVDLNQLDLESTLQTAKKLGFQEQDELADLVEALPMIKAQLAKLKQAGISRAYALLRASDIQSQATSWVLPLEAGSDADAAKEVFASVVPMLRPHFLAEIEATEDAVLASATKLQMKQLKSASPTRSNLPDAMWDALGNGTMGLVLFGDEDEDSRRVIRELMPPLGAPLESITGKLIADGLAWGGLELNLSKTPNLKIAIEANNDEAATTVEQTLEQSYDFLKALPQTKKYLPESEFGFVFGGMKPVRVGNRVTVSTESLFKDLDRFAKVLSPQIKMVRAEAAKTQRMNSLRQLALANHNFESAHRHFPTQATVDKDGKPLLSWRVQILPFIEQSTLYEQFHLDEPWDSEHNLKLVQQMPEIFADPNPQSRRNNKAGKTVYLGAAGKGMIFNGAEKIRFRNILDGSSNTILLVVAAREHAVPWTKPTDWQVDLKNPTAELKETGRTEVEVAIGDGSTHRFSIDTKTETWRRLVQFADGEIVEWPR